RIPEPGADRPRAAHGPSDSREGRRPFQVRGIVIHTSHHTHYVIGTGANDPQKMDPKASRETLDHSIMYIFRRRARGRRLAPRALLRAGMGSDIYSAVTGAIGALRAEARRRQQG